MTWSIGADRAGVPEKQPKAASPGRKTERAGFCANWQELVSNERASSTRCSYWDCPRRGKTVVFVWRHAAAFSGLVRARSASARKMKWDARALQSFADREAPRPGPRLSCRARRKTNDPSPND